MVISPPKRKHSVSKILEQRTGWGDRRGARYQLDFSDVWVAKSISKSE